MDTLRPLERIRGPQSNKQTLYPYYYQECPNNTQCLLNYTYFVGFDTGRIDV